MKFAKTPNTKPAANGRLPAADSPAEAANAAIPLRLSALVEPYRKDGALLFRIERLPRRARLTVGRNNGDRTWTLNDREIEDAGYLPATDAEQSPELSLRIIAMPSGQTVALLDLPVPAAKHGHFSAATESRPRQRDQNQVTASEGADRAGHAGFEQTPPMTKAGDGAQPRLAETFAVWRRETAAALKDAEKTWKAEEAARFACARAQWQEETANAVAKARAEAGRGAQQHNLQTALADAERQWKTAGAARDAAAELQWQKKLDAAVAEARAEAVARLSAETGEVRRLHSEMAAVRSTLAKCEIELSAARKEVEELRSCSQRTVESALQQAEANWKAGEAARRIEAEAQWREQTEKAVAAARSSGEKARDKQIQHELERVNEEMSVAKASLAERDTMLTKLYSAFSQAQTDWQREKESALSGAENAWRAAEAARLAAVTAEWQAQSDKALADARAETGATRKEYSASDGHRLHEKLAERANELTQMRAAFLDERARLQREASEQLLEAEKNWKLDEIARVTQAKELWQAQTEKAVAEARSASGAAREVAGDIELRRLRAEYTALKATLASRELELRRAQTAAGRTTDDRIILRPDRIRPAPHRERNEKRDDSGKRGFALSVVLVAGLASCVVFLYPSLDFILRPPSRAAVSALDSAPTPVPAIAPQGTPAADKLALVVRGANVRTAPSGDATVMLTLPRGTEVAPLERRGSWTRIQVKPDGNSAEPREGWIFTPFLKDATSP